MSLIQLPRPQVGVAIVIRKQGKILVHRRICPHAYGMWACPGGHMEGGETFEQTALRELSEEVGDAIQVANVRFWTVTNDRYWDEGKHYVTIFMLADWVNGEAINMEPTKAESWGWYDWGLLPKPRMSGLVNILARGMNPINA